MAPQTTARTEFAAALNQICAERGIEPEVVVQLARDYGTAKPAAIRLNYGMQRHAGGGIAARRFSDRPAPAGSAFVSLWIIHLVIVSTTQPGSRCRVTKINRDDSWPRGDGSAAARAAPSAGEIAARLGLGLLRSRRRWD